MCPSVSFAFRNLVCLIVSWCGANRDTHSPLHVLSVFPPILALKAMTTNADTFTKQRSNTDLSSNRAVAERRSWSDRQSLRVGHADHDKNEGKENNRQAPASPLLFTNNTNFIIEHFVKCHRALSRKSNLETFR